MAFNGRSTLKRIIIMQLQNKNENQGKGTLQTSFIGSFGHAQCDEMSLNSAFYHQNPVYFPQM